MKLHCTTYTVNGIDYAEFATSGAGASKIRTRLKRLNKTNDVTSVATEEADVPTTRTELVAFLNGLKAHVSWNDD